MTDVFIQILGISKQYTDTNNYLQISLIGPCLEIPVIDLQMYLKYLHISANI